MLETDVRPDQAVPAAGAAVPADGMPGPAALSVVIAGGLVEGTALGIARSTVLARVAPALARARYLAAALLVAGLGWAAASAPSALGGGGDAEQPPVLVIVLGAVALGLVVGTLLGAADAATLRGAVRHPGRWVVANAAAWPVAMVPSILGATAPDAGRRLRA